jgi:hypothetical protein
LKDAEVAALVSCQFVVSRADALTGPVVWIDPLGSYALEMPATARLNRFARSRT